MISRSHSFILMLIIQSLITQPLCAQGWLNIIFNSSMWTKQRQLNRQQVIKNDLFNTYVRPKNTRRLVAQQEVTLQEKWQKVIDNSETADINGNTPIDVIINHTVNDAKIFMGLQKLAEVADGVYPHDKKIFNDPTVETVIKNGHSWVTVKDIDNGHFQGRFHTPSVYDVERTAQTRELMLQFHASIKNIAEETKTKLKFSISDNARSHHSQNISPKIVASSNEMQQLGIITSFNQECMFSLRKLLNIASNS